MMRHAIDRRVRWSRTRNPFFPHVAVVANATWVLRINGFPDHPIYTLFIDGMRHSDVEETPNRWEMDESSDVLTTEMTEVALAPVLDLIAYGSEVGQPCDNPFCCG